MKTTLVAPTVTPISFPWKQSGEDFITYFSHHAIERLQEYRIDLTTINHPIVKLADSILELPVGNTFAVIDERTQTTTILEIESGYDLTIYLNVITVINSTTYWDKKNDFALKVDRIFYMEG